MIKAKKGKLVVNGHPMELLNEYRVITKEMVKMMESEGFEKEQIKEQLTTIINMPFMTEEEKTKKIQELTNELFTDITEVLDKILGKEEKDGADNGGEKYRVWCETNEIRDKVLKKFDNDGLRWASGLKPLERKPHNAPMGFHIYENKFYQSKSREYFDEDDSQEVNAEDLIKEAECNE